MKENIENLNNIIYLLNQLETKSTQLNIQILYNIYGLINKIIEDLNKKNIPGKIINIEDIDIMNSNKKDILSEKIVEIKDNDDKKE
jgi:hypothetical protein